MKECTCPEKHSSCEHKAWSGDKTHLLCLTSSHSQYCNYESIFINFDNVLNKTIMYYGDIERTREFKTKADWVKLYDKESLLTEFGDDWHTATTSIASLSLQDLIEDISESQEMYEEWALYIWEQCSLDEVVLSGFKRLNEIMSKEPTYWEDKKVIF